MDETFIVEMGRRIHEKRISLRLSQEELAERAEISKQTVSRAENGLRELGAQNVSRLAQALEVSADYLLTGERTETDVLRLDSKIKNLTNRQYKYIEELIQIFVKMCEDGVV